MAEDFEKQDENVIDAASVAEDEYEYEYIELEEGEELPEGVEYEYIEVPVDEGVSEEVVNEALNGISEPMPAPVVEAAPVSAPEPMPAPVVEAAPVSAPGPMPAPVVEAAPVSAPEPMPAPVVEAAPVSAPEPMPAPVVEAAPVSAPEPMPAPVVEAAPVSAPEPMPAPVVEAAPVSAPEPMLSPTQTVPEPVLSVPPMRSVQPSVLAAPSVVENEDVTPVAHIAEIDEEDLNALLDNEDEITEIDTSALLKNDTDNDFEKSLFEAPKVEGIQEVSIDDILGIEDEGEEANISLPQMDDVEEISLNDLTTDSEQVENVEEINPEDLLKEESAVSEVVEELTPITEEELLAGTDDQVWFNDDEGKDVAEAVVPEVEAVAASVVESTAAPVEEAVPESVVEPEVISIQEPAPTIEESAVSEVVEELTPITEEELLAGTDDQVWFNDVEGKDVAEAVVPEVEAVAASVVKSTAAPVEETVPESVVEPEVISIQEPAPTIEEPAVSEAVEEVTPITEEELLAGTDDQVWFNDDEGKDVAEAVVPEVEAVTAPVVEPVITSAEEPVSASVVSAQEIQKQEEPKEEVVPIPVVSEAKEVGQGTEIKISHTEYSEEALSPEMYSQLAASGKVVAKDGSMQFFADENDIGILLTYDAGKLADWNLVIFNQNVIPVDMKSKSIKLSQDKNTVRYAKIIKNGSEKLELYNDEQYNFENPEEGFVKAQSHFIYGSVDGNTGIIVNDYINIPLFDKAGKTIVFKSSVSGLLSGPNSSMVFFAKVKKIGIAENTQIKEDAEKALMKAARWYSGSMSDKYFEFSASSQSGEFVGNDETDAIHVNIGNSAYGWNVTFDGGIVMSMKDLQEFQTKHGKLPAKSGEIVHGALKLKFSNVERIVVYQAPQYFAYGKAGN